MFFCWLFDDFSKFEFLNILLNLENSLKIPCFDLINSVSEFVNKEIIGVLATPTTIKSSYYEKSISCKKENLIIYQQECPEFVPEIEKNTVDIKKLNYLSELYLEPLLKKNVEQLILGCSHYPLIKEILENPDELNLDITNIKNITIIILK